MVEIERLEEVLAEVAGTPAAENAVPALVDVLRERRGL